MANARPNRIRIGALVGAIGGAALLPFACDNGAKTTSPAASATAAVSAAPPVATAPANRGGPRKATDAFTWKKPEAWTQTVNPTPSSPFQLREATYSIARVGDDLENAELAVSAAGGSREGNIQRWEGQFSGAKAKTAQKNPNGVAVTIAEIEGEFTSGGPMMGGGTGKKPGWMMLAAMADMGNGAHAFFKLTGPKKTVESARQDFDALIDSIAPKN